MEQFPQQIAWNLSCANVKIACLTVTILAQQSIRTIRSVPPSYLGVGQTFHVAPSMKFLCPQHLADLRASQNCHQMVHYIGAICKHPTYHQMIGTNNSIDGSDVTQSGQRLSSDCRKLYSPEELPLKSQNQISLYLRVRSVNSIKQLSGIDEEDDGRVNSIRPQKYIQ